MKKILASLICVTLLNGCVSDSEPDDVWTPDVIVGDVGCCVTDHQVHGAIYYALLKLRWKIREKTENGFVAEMPCEINGKPINTVFKNTDKDYTITAEQEVFDIYKARSCIEYNLDKVDNYINRYLDKAKMISAKKDARNEINTSK